MVKGVGKKKGGAPSPAGVERAIQANKAKIKGKEVRGGVSFTLQQECGLLQRSRPPCAGGPQARQGAGCQGQAGAHDDEVSACDLAEGRPIKPLPLENATPCAGP